MLLQAHVPPAAADGGGLPRCHALPVHGRLHQQLHGYAAWRLPDGPADGGAAAAGRTAGQGQTGTATHVVVMLKASCLFSKFRVYG